MQFTGSLKKVKRAVGVAAVVALGGVMTAQTPRDQVGAAPVPSTAGTASSSQRQFLDQYCVSCHNEKLKTAGIVLDRLDVTRPAEHADVWEKVIRKLRAGAMPPVGRPRPDKEVNDRFTSWLEGELDRVALASPNPGRTMAFHRLNRTEYRNAIRDLLGIDGVDVNMLLPADDSSYGFDNIAGVLRLSSTLFERYLSAARKISRMAVGDSRMVADTVTFRLREDKPQWDQLDTLPFGSRGGVRVRHYFPVTGEYVLGVRVAGAVSLARPHDLEIAVDGERVKLVTLTGESARRGQYIEETEQAEEARIIVKAGLRDVSATFVKISAAQPEGFVQAYARPLVQQPLMPFLSTLSIAGPYAPVTVDETASRARIFACRPGPSAGIERERQCATEIVSRLARAAYRRPVSPADVDTLMEFYDAGRQEAGFETGVARAIERLLVSPSFLFRIEQDPAGLRPNASYRVSDLELASRLSFFLWSSIPDEELLALAARGKLANRAVLDKQVSRMLASPKADALVSNFVNQWLQLRNLDATEPNENVFPVFDDTLRQSARRETELLFQAIMQEGRSALDLLNADFTFVNERLARHYGLPSIYGSRFRRIAVTDEARRGLLGHAGILTVTSYATRTSPVVRGKWILDNLLGSSPPPPPPDIPAPPLRSATGQALSMRQSMEQHRASASCASCHAQMDPLGFALENFDAVGRWRSRSEANTPIDASGALPGGVTFEGVNGLRTVLLAQPERFVNTLTQKLMTYALGRGIEHYDMPAVRRIIRETAPDNYKLSALVTGIVSSVPFQMRRGPS